jgi:transposase
MAPSIHNPNGLILTREIENESAEVSSEPSIADSQVKIRKSYSTRRTYDTAYKLRILAAFNNCENASERGALLRKEGLYHSRIIAWKQQLENSKLNGKKQHRNELRTDHLTRENEQLKKKLAHAEAIIELQKKISDLLGTHILPHEKNGSKL